MFDLDGTLLDTAPDFVMVLNQLRAEHTLAPLADDTIRSTVSNGASALVTLGFGVAATDARHNELRERLLALYATVIGQQTLLFPGIKALLLQLSRQGLFWGIATNKPEIYTRALLNNIELPVAPDIVICPDNVTHRKPHPESLFKAAAQFGCRAESIIYLGDHRRDIECGINAGATTIACEYGYIELEDPATNWNADYVVNDSTQLSALIDKLTSHKPQ